MRLASPGYREFAVPLRRRVLTDDVPCWSITEAAIISGDGRSIGDTEDDERLIDAKHATNSKP